MTPEISIIVPVYNVEKYLHRCIDSILAQTFKNFECILIDDGSPDNCPAICDEYAAKDPRIQVIHQKNAGVSAARNAGLAAARGNWIGFVDSDDWIEPETYETAYNTAKEKNADLVQWNIIAEKEKKYIGISTPLKEGCFSIAEDATYFSPSMCHKLIFSKLICDNNITFPQDIRLSEDRLVSFQCYIAATNCYQIENVFYHYEQRESSASHNMTHDMILQEVNIIRIMQDIASTKDPDAFGKLILNEKIEFKTHLIFFLRKPDFHLYHSLYPECNKSMTKVKGKRRLVYQLLYFHLDFIASIIISTWKIFENIKNSLRFIVFNDTTTVRNSSNNSIQHKESI